jgi:hypothetical protein
MSYEKMEAQIAAKTSALKIKSQTASGEIRNPKIRHVKYLKHHPACCCALYRAHYRFALWL